MLYSIGLIEWNVNGCIGINYANETSVNLIDSDNSIVEKFTFYHNFQLKKNMHFRVFARAKRIDSKCGGKGKLSPIFVDVANQWKYICCELNEIKKISHRCLISYDRF